jgi:5-methylcytosine-specific restriction endonuclease McrA
MGCAATVSPAGYCDKHKGADVNRRSTLARFVDPVSHALYHTARWSKERRLFLQLHPLCRPCMQAGRLTGATQVDHVIPHKGNYEAFFRLENWQPICASCHSRKTQREQQADRAAETGEA